jgi:hypothetical protein
MGDGSQTAWSGCEDLKAAWGSETPVGLQPAYTKNPVKLLGEKPA